MCVCAVATDRKKARHLILQFSYITAPPPWLLRSARPSNLLPDLSTNESGDSSFTQIDLEESKTHRETRARRRPAAPTTT